MAARGFVSWAKRGIIGVGGLGGGGMIRNRRGGMGGEKGGGIWKIKYTKNHIKNKI